MNFTSRSQAGQDLLVHSLLPTHEGFFVEIGSSHPVELSNTYALELLGWRGIGIDISEDAIALCRAQRSSRSQFLCRDATTVDWQVLLLGRPRNIEYLSCDVDEVTTQALRRVLESGSRFAVITVEHDAYQRGDRLRIPNRELLKTHGYEIIAADVHNTGCAFEDWSVAPDLVDMKVAERFRSTGLDWADVLKKGNAL